MICLPITIGVTIYYHLPRCRCINVPNPSTSRTPYQPSFPYFLWNSFQLFLKEFPEYRSVVAIIISSNDCFSLGSFGMLLDINLNIIEITLIIYNCSFNLSTWSGLGTLIAITFFFVFWDLIILILLKRIVHSASYRGYFGTYNIHRCHFSRNNFTSSGSISSTSEAAIALRNLTGNDRLILWWIKRKGYSFSLSSNISFKCSTN